MKAKAWLGSRVVESGCKVGLLLVLALLLAGCPDSESTVFSEDLRELTNPIQNNDPDVYRGRVMNGNLENAVVWLDMEQNGQLSEGDPWGWSDANGEFELDITDLQTDPAEGADLNPADYPLMAVAIPGHTRDQHADEVVEKAFFLMAPPGHYLMSPFTTMVEARRRLPFAIEHTTADARLKAAGTDVRRRIGEAEDRPGGEEVSLMQDYQLSLKPRTPFYAEALRRFIQAQVPQARSDAIADAVVDAIADDRIRPQISALNAEDLKVIGALMLDQIRPLLIEVDERITAQGIEGFKLPPLDAVADLGPDLSNPWLLREQVVYLPKAGEGEKLNISRINTNDIDGRVVARVLYDYSAATTLRRVDVKGESRPSLSMIAALMNHGGRMAEMGRQPWLDVNVDESNVDRADGNVLERFSGPDHRAIAWSEREVVLDSAIIAGTSTAELDGTADREYQASDTDGANRVTALERIIPYQGEGNHSDTSLSIVYNGDAQPISLPLAFADEDDITLTFGPVRHFDDLEGCASPTSDSSLVVNAQQAVTIHGSSASGTLTRYGHWRENPEYEFPQFRVLMEEFVPEDGVNERRELEYFDDRGDLLSPEQPDLVRSLRMYGMTTSIGNRFCGGDSDGTDGERSLKTNDLDLYIEFEYLTFSEHLEQQGSGN